MPKAYKFSYLFTSQSDPLNQVIARTLAHFQPHAPCTGTIGDSSGEILAEIPRDYFQKRKLNEISEQWTDVII